LPSTVSRTFEVVVGPGASVSIRIMASYPPVMLDLAVEFDTLITHVRIRIHRLLHIVDGRGADLFIFVNFEIDDD
jgi:hypothetical protein